MRTVERWYRLLVRGFPPGFRRRFGPELIEQAMEETRVARSRGLGSAALRCMQTTVDLLRAGLAERVRPTSVGDRRIRTRDEGWRMMMSEWIREGRLAVRTLGRSPGFTAAAVATLGITLAVNATIFAAVDAVLLEPLPYDELEELVWLGASAPGTDLGDEAGLSAEFFLEYRDRAGTLAEIAHYNSFTATLRTGDRAERLRMSTPAPSLFRTLGVEPVLGRLPDAAADQGEIVISHALWSSWFGSDPGVLGTSVEAMDGSRTIVGVMGPDFGFPNEQVVLWIPGEIDTSEGITIGQFTFDVVARMSPGAERSAVEAELSGIARGLPELYGGTERYAEIVERHRPIVRPLRAEIVGDLSTALFVLMGAVTVVLLIACANVANLFTVRAEGRGRDLAVRRALGAGRRQLVRVQMAEAVLVAAMAATLAVLLLSLGFPGFQAAVPDSVPRLDGIVLAPPTLGYLLLASVGTALLCGWWPARRAARADLGRLRDATRGSTSRRHLIRDGLVVAQTALALVLLVGSGLLLRSFSELRAIDPGYRTDGVFTFQFAPEEAHLTDAATWAAFHHDFMESLRALPGVDRVGIVENFPLEESPPDTRIVTEENPDPQSEVSGKVTLTAGDYFDLMGIELLAGRRFTRDDSFGPATGIVSETLAHRLWGDEDPLGRRLRVHFFDDWIQVVGVVEDVLQDDLAGAPEPLVYVPIAGAGWWTSSPGYVLETDRGTEIAGDVRTLVGETTPSAPVYRMYTLDQLVDRSTIQLRFTMITLALASGFALLLGAIGLYGVLSYVVTARSREIGVRIALGAKAARVRRMVVGQGLRVVGLGIGIGLVMAVFAVRALEGFLFGVAALDPLTFAATALGMLAIGGVASWVPAWRASRVDPLQAMR